MTRLTQSQQALQYELRDLMNSIPMCDLLPSLRSNLLDIVPLELLETWAEKLTSAAANDRHYKRMDQYNSTDIAMMRGR